MGNSASGGYIKPSGVAAYDQELEDIFQAFIVGITSLPGNLVRPRWQEIPLPLPKPGTDWCAFAIKSIQQDDGPYFHQNDESVASVRHEFLNISLSFYGSHGQHFANTFKDGLSIPQNIDQLSQFKIKFTDAGEIITAPDFLNNQYVHRYDIEITMRRKKINHYQILNFLTPPSIDMG